MAFRDGEIAQLVKYLLHMHKDLTLGFRTNILKRKEWYSMLIVLQLGRKREEDL